jgi:hypothetical protein
MPFSFHPGLRSGDGVATGELVLCCCQLVCLLTIGLERMVMPSVSAGNHCVRNPPDHREVEMETGSKRLIVSLMGEILISARESTSPERQTRNTYE